MIGITVIFNQDVFFLLNGLFPGFIDFYGSLFLINNPIILNTDRKTLSNARFERLLSSIEQNIYLLKSSRTKDFIKATKSDPVINRKFFATLLNAGAEAIRNAAAMQKKLRAIIKALYKTLAQAAEIIRREFIAAAQAVSKAADRVLKRRCEINMISRYVLKILEEAEPGREPLLDSRFHRVDIIKDFEGFEYGLFYFEHVQLNNA